MKTWQGQTTLNFNWADVAAALWQRYPNSYSKHVVTEDTVKRKVKDGKLFTIRIFTKVSQVPNWATKLNISNSVLVQELSVVDPVKQVFVTVSRNLSQIKALAITERCTYTPHPTEPNQTVVKRQVWITSQMTGFRTALESFGKQRYRFNLKSTGNGLLEVLNKRFRRSPSSSN